MSSEGGQVLYVRRLTIPKTVGGFTVGKLYLVREAPEIGEYIVSDHGTYVSLEKYGRYDVLDEYFTRVWVWPNGTEVDEL
jgi:hypothetical protein